MPSVLLANDRLRLALEPEIGASVTAFEACLSGAWAPVLRPTGRPLERSSNASCFTLAPYSNRIRDGVFVFEGRRHPLRHPEKHAIHGDVRDRAWRVLSASGEEARFELDARALPDFNFPVPIVARVTHALEGMAWTLSLRLENAGSEPMPMGMGFHPYFERALGGRAENVELALRVGGMYPGDGPLPSGPPVGVPPACDFSRLRPLDVAIDRCFAGWDGRASLRWPVSDVVLHLEATPPFRHVIVFSPESRPWFALEPVSNANDGFNLLAAGQSDTGVVVLAPGEALEGSVRLVLEA